MRIRWVPACVGFVAFGIAALLAVAQEITVRQSVRQLFFNEAFIDFMDHVEQVVNQPVKHPTNPVLKREHLSSVRKQPFG